MVVKVTTTGYLVRPVYQLALCIINQVIHHQMMTSRIFDLDDDGHVAVAPQTSLNVSDGAIGIVDDLSGIAIDRRIGHRSP